MGLVWGLQILLVSLAPTDLGIQLKLSHGPKSRTWVPQLPNSAGPDLAAQLTRVQLVLLVDIIYYKCN